MKLQKLALEMLIEDLCYKHDLRWDDVEDYLWSILPNKKKIRRSQSFIVRPLLRCKDIEEVAESFTKNKSKRAIEQRFERFLITFNDLVEKELVKVENASTN